MCFEETCLPLCARFSHYDTPYCRGERLRPQPAAVAARPVVERQSAPTAQVPLGFTFQDVVESFKRLLSGK